MVITGSPPFLLHFVVSLNLVLRRRLIYRITDFHPECLGDLRPGAGLPCRHRPDLRPAPTGRPLRGAWSRPARGCARSAFRGADRVQARPRTGHDHRPGASTSAPAVEGRRSSCSTPATGAWRTRSIPSSRVSAPPSSRQPPDGPLAQCGRCRRRRGRSALARRRSASGRGRSWSCSICCRACSRATPT